MTELEKFCAYHLSGMPRTPGELVLCKEGGTVLICSKTRKENGSHIPRYEGCGYSCAKDASENCKKGLSLLEKKSEHREPSKIY